MFADGGKGRAARLGRPLDLTKKCHLCHFLPVKTISIKQLHATTGRYVREASTQAVYVTDHGRPVAVLKPMTAEELPGRPFPRRRSQDLPAVGVDSTAGIAEERGAR